MKKLTFISGALSGSFIGLGTLSELQHYPGGELLIFGLLIFSLLFIPSVTKYLYDKDK